MKKIIKKLTLVLGTTMLVSTVLFASEATQITYQEKSISQPINNASHQEVTQIGISKLQDTKTADITKSLNLAKGESWTSKSFSMNSLSSTHNTFNVKLSNISGKYKVLITSTKGYEWESSERTTGTTFTTTNARNDVYYEVTVINTGTGSLTGKCEITSYIE